MMKTLRVILLTLAFAIPPARGADVHMFNTLADLAAWVPSTLASNFTVRTYDASRPFATPRPGHYDPSSTAATNLGCVFATSTGIGRNLMDDCNGGEIDVRWFGAKVDNVTDDTAAVSNAIAYAVQWRGETGGGTVRIPRGDVRCNVAISTPYADEESVTIIGSGNGASALRPFTTNSPTIWLTGWNIQLENLMIKGDIATPGGTGLKLGNTNLVVGAVVQASFRNIHIRDYDVGLYIEGLDQAHFDRMTIIRCTNGLLASPRWYAASGGNNGAFSKVKFTSCVWQGNYGDAVTIRGGYTDQIDFDTCVFEQNDGKAAVIQQYNTLSGNPMRGIGFRNCFFEFNNNGLGAGDYHDIEVLPALTTGGFQNLYTVRIEDCWFQTESSSNIPICIWGNGQFTIRQNDLLGSNTTYLQVTNSPTIYTDTPSSKISIPSGSPQIEWYQYQRLGIRGLSDPADRLVLTNIGQILIGDGTNAPDTNIRRSQAGIVTTDGTWRSAQSTTNDQAYLAGVNGDTLARLSITADGMYGIGPGNATRDVFLLRSGVGEMTLRTNVIIPGSLRVYTGPIWGTPVGSNDVVFLAGYQGASVSAFSISGLGAMTWGDGSAIRTNFSLYLTNGNTLHLGGPVQAQALLYTSTNLYEDLQFNISTLNPTGPLTGPTIVDTSGRDGEGEAAVFNTGDVLQWVTQMPHTWVTNTTIYPHLHIEPQTADAITNTWIVKYSVSDIGQEFPTWTLVTNTVVIAAGNQWKHQLLAIPTNGIPMTGKNGPSTVVRFRASLTSNVDTHVLSADVHYRVRGSPVAYVAP